MFSFLILRLNANLQFVRIFIFRGCSFFRGEFVFSLRSDRDTSHFAVCSAIRHSVEQLAAAQPRSCRQRAVKLASLSVSTVDDDAQRALRKRGRNLMPPYFVATITVQSKQNIEMPLQGIHSSGLCRVILCNGIP